jgi:putative transcriptional regulator
MGFVALSPSYELHMSQHEFARTYRIPLATLKNWEEGRRHPEATAAAYLQVIAKGPPPRSEVLERCASRQSSE